MTLAVVDASRSAPDTIAGVVARNPDLVVLTSVEPRTDLAAWGGVPLVALPAKRPRHHVSRFDGIGRTDVGGSPYGHLTLGAGSDAWRLVYLTTHEGRHLDEQQYWLPRVAGPPLVVVVDSDNPTADALREDLVGHLKPLDLAVWITPGGATVPLPGGAFAPLEIQSMAGVSWIELSAGTIRVETRNAAFHRARLGWVDAEALAAE